jgi:hypothetical protein
LDLIYSDFTQSTGVPEQLYSVMLSVVLKFYG